MSDRDQHLFMDVTTHGGQAAVAVTGELDFHTTPELSVALEQFGSAPDVTEVVLDLQGVQFIDSAGLRLIVSSQDTMAEQGRHLVVRSPSTVVRRVLEITDLLDELDIED